MQPASADTVGGQSQLKFLRAYVQYTPFFPTAAVGTAIIKSFGEYALVSTSLYMAEPI